MGDCWPNQERGGECVHHDLSNLLRVVPVQVEPEGHHLPVVSLQLTLGHSVSSAGNLRAGWVVGTLAFGEAACSQRGRGESRSGFALTLRTLSLALAIFSWRDRLRTERLWCRLTERPSWRPPPPPPAAAPPPPSLPSLRPEVSEWPLKFRVAKFNRPSSGEVLEVCGRRFLPLDRGENLRRLELGLRQLG